MLANDYQGTDPAGWLMSEKLDGIRAIWTGTALVSRNGNTFNAPDWFLAALPAGIVIDGELYMGRGKLQATAGAVRRKSPDDAEWRAITYRVFDAPEIHAPFEQRHAAAADAVAASQVARIVEHTVCRDEAHLAEYFTALTTAGAEGVMLRAPGSDYTPRRSNNLLKHKPYADDEAEVIGSEPGTGRLAGMVGALLCQWRGITFRLAAGLNDALRAAPLAPGTRLTFQYSGTTDIGLPRHPVFLVVRSYE